MTPDIKQKAQQIKLLILDVDGILTDGKIYITDEGKEFKGFHSRDGIGVKLLLKHGIEIAIISGRETKAVNFRLKPFGMTHIYQNIEDKLAKFKELQKKLNLSLNEIAYMGDDLPDLPVMSKVGFSITVLDADAFVKQHADYITTLPGGRGAVREAAELILAAQGKLETIQQQFLSNE